MKGYSTPNVDILYLSSDDVMQNSLELPIAGDPAETIPEHWEDRINGGNS